MDDTAFWRLVEDARRASAGDVDGMAEEFRSSLADADRRTLIDVQRSLVQASGRLYTWRHSDAAELICGYLGDDGFTDFRTWVITRGRTTFEAVVADPDALADVEDVEEACEGAELFGTVPGELYDEKTGSYFPEDVPILEGLGPPSGERLSDPAAIRRALPKLATRFPKDGLGKGPVR